VDRLLAAGARLTMGSEETLFETEEKMEGAVTHLAQELRGLRSGRASPHLVDGLKISYYGTLTPLGQMAQIGCPEPRLIVIKPFDASQIPEVEKAIRTSNLGLNPQSDGKVVRIPIPSLTEERRKDLAKKAHHMAEEARVEIRRFRHEGNDRLKKMYRDKEISEDDERRALEETQKLTDKKIAEVDEVLKGKEKEILAV
jgi:ribosome recycling factor